MSPAPLRAVIVLTLAWVTTVSCSGHPIVPGDQGASLRGRPPALHTSVQARIELALSRFEESGLELPADLIIHVEQRGEDCRLPTTSYDPPTVTYCVPWHGEDAWEHELAHVWVERHLADDDREAFRDWLGLPTWRSKEHPWIRRATEWAAVAIQRYVTDPKLSGRQAEIAEWLLDAAGIETTSGEAGMPRAWTSHASNFECGNCGRTRQAERLQSVCTSCAGPLLVRYRPEDPAMHTR